MSLTSYLSFGSFENSRGIERRLEQKYMQNFDDILLISRDSRFNRFCKNKTSSWRSILESTMLAIRIDVLEQLHVDVVLLDDDEFGKEIKWFFKPEIKLYLNIKDVLLLVENIMELIRIVATDESMLDQIIVDTPYNYNPIENTTKIIKSASFCINYSTDALIPPNLNDYRHEINSARKIISSRFTCHRRGMERSIACWRVFFGIQATMKMQADNQLAIITTHGKLIKFPVFDLFMGILKVQLEIISDIIITDLLGVE
jgi:hypothetical protein